MKNFILLLLLCSRLPARAQDFITHGNIEYEIKQNNKMMYAGQDTTNDPFITQLPHFDVHYRNLVFTHNKSVYMRGRAAAVVSMRESDNAVYIDLDAYKTVRSVQNFNEQFAFEDSLPKLTWKIQNETRIIAGFTCRKAIAIIEDSVYVIAFYCPQVVSNAGPELFTGLPGMILGLAIPRYYTTWFATRIEVANVDETVIVPPLVKKKKTYTKKELADVFLKKYIGGGIWKEATLDAVLSGLNSPLVE